MSLKHARQPDLRAVAKGRHHPFKTTNFSVDEGLAFAQLRAALRPYRVEDLRGAVFILRLPDTLLHDYWGRAVDHFFRLLKDSARDFELKAAGWPEHNEPEATDTFRNHRFLDAEQAAHCLRADRDFICVLVPSDYKIDPSDALVVDFETSIAPATIEMATAALRAYGVKDPPDELVQAFLDAEEGRRWIPMRKSAPPAELLSRFYDLENPYRHRRKAADENDESMDEFLDRVAREPARTEPAKKKGDKKKARDRNDSPEIEPVEIQTLRNAPDLEQFAGAGTAVEWAQDLKRDLADFKAGKISWEDVDKGALLHGPPGCGKTSFARALAKSLDVPLFEKSGAEWMSPDGVNSGFGDCAKYMKASFRAAKESAPAVLFVDEVDVFCDRAALGSGRNSQWMRDFTNAFLEQLDGFEAREGVVVIGATNHVEVVDPAVRRPGRLDAEIELTFPDTRAREGILRWHLGDAGRDFDLGEVAVASDGMSGADLEKVARQARRTARKANRDLEVGDVEVLFPDLRRSGSVVIDLSQWKRN